MKRTGIRHNNLAFRWLVCLPALAVAGVSLHAADEKETASGPEFALSSAFQAAEQVQATGLYILGTTRIRTWSAAHYVLMRDGLVVQIQTRANGAWLSKLGDSRGGLLIGVAKFDRLLSIAGGANQNAKDLPVRSRNHFYCLAGFGECASTAPPTADRSPHAAMIPMLPFAQHLLSLPFIEAARSDQGGCSGCRPYFALDGTGRAARFEFDTASRRIVFEGWGIRASWLVPPLDEI